MTRQRKVCATRTTGNGCYSGSDLGMRLKRSCTAVSTCSSELGPNFWNRSTRLSNGRHRLWCYIFSKQQMRLHCSACAQHESRCQRLHKRSPLSAPLLKCFPALPVWHVFILCFSNAEQRQQKENIKVRKGCFEQTMAGSLGGADKSPPPGLLRYAVPMGSQPWDKCTLKVFCKNKRGRQRWTTLAPWLFTELKLEDGDGGTLPLISPWMRSQIWVGRRLPCTARQLLKGQWSKTPPAPFIWVSSEGRDNENREDGEDQVWRQLYESGPEVWPPCPRNDKLADTARGIPVSSAHQDVHNLG